MADLRDSRPVLAVLIVVEYVRVVRALRTRSLGAVVRPPGPRPGGAVLPPARLSRGVTRVLGRLAGDRARCIHRALVLQRLLAGQGRHAVLVVGLPGDAVDVRAHAWVELDGRDVGPAPGRGQHLPMARYGGTA